ncbi:MAG: CopD family protein, partial [Leptospiraceae bacterium]|nr:CopD family protein [Leptospiraceae bacterium]
MVAWYLWFKALHIIGVVAWFAAIFYIWRLFVYHAETDSDAVRETLATMERRLYRAIMVPASIFTLVFGILLLYVRWNPLGQTIWIWIKIALIIVLYYLQFLANYYRKQFLLGKTYSSRRFRILNEVPTVILIIVVILAIRQPF